jgi:hypothetical protein
MQRDLLSPAMIEQRSVLIRLAGETLVSPFIR